MRVISAGPSLVITSLDSSDSVGKSEELESASAGVPIVELSEEETPAQDSGDFHQSSKEGFKHLLDFINKKNKVLPAESSQGTKRTIAVKTYTKVAEVSHPEELTGLILDKAG